MDKIPWYVARSSGIVAWALILATIVWGLLLATKVLGRKPGPAWVLSLHRYLGALAVAFVGVHVGAIVLDTYTSFGITDVLVSNEVVGAKKIQRLAELSKRAHIGVCVDNAENLAAIEASGRETEALIRGKALEAEHH